MAHRNKVIRSINQQGDMVCVDIFQRPDGSFGFDEFRRDAEDLQGWFSIGHYGARIYPTADAALLDAQECVGWLCRALNSE